MQLQSIDQVKDLMYVWHPIYGNGKVIYKGRYSCTVSFDKIGGSACFDDKGTNNDPYHTSHLYTEPITVIAESEVTRLKELVKAQKELIRELDHQINAEYLTMEDIIIADEIRDKIKSLENQDK